ncbi:MAG: hypothetical protein ACOCUH_03445, partial [Bacteriovoracia bacterium]
MKKLLTLALTVFFVSSLSFAEGITGGKCGSVPQDGDDLTFEEFKLACVNPSCFGNQVPPTRIKVLCGMKEFYWEAQESGPMDIPSANYMMAELFSNKYHVGKQYFCGDTLEDVAECPQYQELKAKLVSEKLLCCDDVVGENITLEEICANHLADVIAENPEAPTITPTGRDV